MFTVSRSKNNPVLAPCRNHAWESVATFNASPVIYEGKRHLLYRAMSTVDPLVDPQFRLSVIGRAVSADDGRCHERSVLLGPDYDYERYGLEDPRVTAIDGTHFIFYTALGGFPFTADNIKIAVALSKDLHTVDEKHLVTPFNAKAMALFPEKINGEYLAILSVNTDRKPSDIAIARFAHKEQIWSQDYWHKWYAERDQHTISIKRKDSDQVEVGAVPIKTKDGWLLIYSHIQEYGSDHPVFGVEALLLDLNNPQKILHRTKGPFMVPEEYYECIGMVPNIVFPSGALLENNTIALYYGGADTVVAVAHIPLDTLLAAIMRKSPLAQRCEPILEPRNGLDWEAGGVFNPAAVDIDHRIYILYRAATTNNVSTMGLAITQNGKSIDERLDYPVYIPREVFETSADKKVEHFGTEDPRLVHIGDRLYMTYTAFNGDIARVALSSIAVSDFVARRFDRWAPAKVISPADIYDKNACIFPEAINGRYVVLHRVAGHICLDFVKSLAFDETLSRCIEILGPRRGMWDGRKIGMAAPPIKTPQGWLLFYHGLSDRRVYRVGAVLLDLDDPTLVRARSAFPLLTPLDETLADDRRARIIFPCGVVLRDNLIYMYYGVGDQATGLAVFHLDKVLETLRG